VTRRAVGDGDVAGLALEPMVAVDVGGEPAARKTILLVQYGGLMTGRAGFLGESCGADRRMLVRWTDDSMFPVAVRTDRSIGGPTLHVLPMDALPIVLGNILMAFAARIRDIQPMDCGFRIVRAEDSMGGAPSVRIGGRVAVVARRRKIEALWVALPWTLFSYSLMGSARRLKCFFTRSMSVWQVRQVLGRFVGCTRDCRLVEGKMSCVPWQLQQRGRSGSLSTSSRPCFA